MIRRSFWLLMMIAVFVAFGSFSACAMEVKRQQGKHVYASLTGCSIYQLGSNEFILKLQGKNLPEPASEFSDNSMYITLEDTKAVKPESINASVLNVIEAMPVIVAFNIENISPDKVAITIASDSELEVQSVSKVYGGYNLKISTPNQEELKSLSILSAPQRFVAKKLSTAYPNNSLPFSIPEKITVELRDAELRDVLRLLMARVGRNIIIDTSFPNDIVITMSLFDVRIDEVLNHLMRTYDISCYNSGNTTTFGTREGLYKLSGAKTIKSFRISYAEVPKVITMLKNLASVQDSELTADDRTRMLYVNTNPAKMSEVEELIEKIDIPSRQVMIRASIFEFSERVSKQVETALNMAYDDLQLSIGGGIGANYYQDRSVRQTPVPRTARTLEATLAALEEDAKGRVIANPSVIATDGEKATIELTHTYTYSVVRDDAGNAISQQEDVGPTLTFTPKIERDDTVYLELELSTGDVLSTGTNGTPITSDRSVTTKVRVKNGMPFVVGGLFQNNNTTSVSRIPVLGHLPLIGNLFTSRVKSNQRNQVVMIVTPYILND